MKSELLVLGELAMLQSLRVERQRKASADASRESDATFRAAEQVRAALANQQASWRLRFAAAVGVSDVRNANSAIDFARGRLTLAAATAAEADARAYDAKHLQRA